MEPLIGLVLFAYLLRLYRFKNCSIVRIYKFNIPLLGKFMLLIYIHKIIYNDNNNVIICIYARSTTIFITYCIPTSPTTVSKQLM